MPKVTELPESEDNDPVVKLIKSVTHAVYEHEGELSSIEIVGVLESVKHSILFDASLDEVEWEE